MEDLPLQSVLSLRRSRSRVRLPLFASRIPAGFPSPADDHLEKSLDLNDYLIHRPAATFFARAEGYSMINAGIRHGDLLIVDRSLQPRDGAIVIAALNGELTVKRLRLTGNKIRLVPENPEFPPLEITDAMDFHIWGVVKHVVHSF